MDNIQKEVLEILQIDTYGSGCNFLGHYNDASLEEARKILESEEKKKTLYTYVVGEIELRKSIRTKEKVKSTNGNWLPPYWLAMQSLFGKGTWKFKDDTTKIYLDLIKPEWKNNCSGKRSKYEKNLELKDVKAELGKLVANKKHEKDYTHKWNEQKEYELQVLTLALEILQKTKIVERYN